MLLLCALDSADHSSSIINACYRSLVFREGMWACEHVCVYVHACVHTYSICVCVHACISYMNVCVCVCLYIHLTHSSTLSLPLYLKAATVPSAQSLRLMEFSFSDFELSDAETTQATIRMFVDLNLVQNFQMKYKVGGCVCVRAYVHTDVRVC